MSTSTESTMTIAEAATTRVVAEPIAVPAPSVEVAEPIAVPAPSAEVAAAVPVPVPAPIVAVPAHVQHAELEAEKENRVVHTPASEVSMAARQAPPRPGLLRRTISGVEYWVHHLSGEVHSAVFHYPAVGAAPEPAELVAPADPVAPRAAPDPAPNMVHADIR